MVMLMSITSSFTLLPLNPNLSPVFSPAKLNRSIDYQFRIISGRGIRVRNSNQTAEVTSSPSSDSVTDLESASSVVRKFYGGINSRDLDSVEQLIAENCVYEDLVFPQPFVGRKEILNFFKKFTDSVGSDLQFVIDDISQEDSSAVGVTWHLEWRGRPFPFSKGCSFYRLEVVNGQRQILYGRDSVEPAVKPGETALNIALTSMTRAFEKIKRCKLLCIPSMVLAVPKALWPGLFSSKVAIRGVAWLLQQFPQLADRL